MEIIIPLAAFLASLLTLFSGFGLGTILTPIFGLFFPIHLAVALTGIVHLLNNLFKVSLLGKSASKPMVWRFGLPSILGGLGGALVLAAISRVPAIFVWNCCGKDFAVTPLKCAIGTLMIVFALMELVPAWKNLRFEQRHFTLGGLLSGFVGGLSGHQGALRSAFLINSGLGKEAFIATGVVIACMVDLTRLPVYFSRFSTAEVVQQWPLLLAATLSAFAGAYLGTRFLRKTTFPVIQKLTAAMIFIIAVLLVAGVL